MRTNDFIKLGKRLLPGLLPGFEIKGSMVFVSPVRKALCGFVFEPSAFGKKDFYINMFFLPLCVPVASIHLTFGHRIGGGRGWSIDQSNLEAALTRELMKEVPFLKSLKGYSDVIRALEPFMKGQNPHCHEAYAYSLIQAGENARAIKTLDDLLHLVDATVPWQEEIASRATAIRSELIDCLEKAQLHLCEWERENVLNLGLEKFWDGLGVGGGRGVVRLSPWLTQTVKTMFAVRCKFLDRQDHFSAF